MEKGTAKQKQKRNITKDSLLNLLPVVYQSGPHEHCMPSGMYLQRKTVYYSHQCAGQACALNQITVLM